MLRFWRMRTLQKFASVHTFIGYHFGQDRSLSPRTSSKINRTTALAE